MSLEEIQKMIVENARREFQNWPEESKHIYRQIKRRATEEAQTINKICQERKNGH